jgi:peroxiredoxin|tara:strand:+ start:250 stop:801 length:552 start_codon:yes stop_codon:yes gene_type:complete
MPAKAGDKFPDFKYMDRVAGEFVEIEFRNHLRTQGKKRIALFGLPGAFTPTCSTQQLPGYEAAYDDLTDFVDEVVCTSVNDPFVMNSWFESLDIKKVMSFPDGNADFAQALGLYVNKRNLNFGHRSWRYSMVVNLELKLIEKVWIEINQRDSADTDVFEVSDAATMLDWLKSNPEAKTEIERS